MNHSTSKLLNRREIFKTIGLATGTLTLSSRSAAQACPSALHTRFCLNTSTIRGQNLPIEQEIDVAGQAGYDAIEPWTHKLHEFMANGGSLKELSKRITDHGLTVESAIGFPSWIVEDDARRARGFEQAKRDMDVLAQIGGKRMAAPPAGIPRGESVEPMKAAERYRQLLELGGRMGIVPQIEMWGGNPTIGRISTAIFIAIESGHPQACFLGDLIHTYRAGCDFEGLRLLGPHALQVYHLNDYPPDPPPERIGDRDRVFPGDGVGPVTKILNIFRSIGAWPVLSLELFNPTYWNRDALEVAKTGLRKMKKCVAAVVH